MSILVFDIETVPDVDSGRKLYDLDGLSDADTAKALFALRQKKTGRTFLQHHLQRIVAISLVMQAGNDVRVWSLGDENSSEAELIQRFFSGLEKHTPTLVSWNGSGFDLPVLHYRALLHNIQAPSYWEVGDQEQAFRWNNYLNRFHYRHLDVMDVLAAYQNKAFAPLDEIATMLGFPGKMGMSGAKVWDEYLAGNLAGIRNYCETDVLNTYCVYLRFEAMRGKLTEDNYFEAIEQLRHMLESEKKPHLTDFLKEMPVSNLT
ncbi:MAG: 3'-5' exonuclease [Gammaproteobacteria bacterium]|nr:3'-5' exonuclease [Gammaproteobacteria bacterium]